MSLLDRLTRAYQSGDKEAYQAILMEESVLPMAVYDPDGTITKHMVVGEYQSDHGRITELVVRTTTPEGETFQIFRPHGPPRKTP